MKCKDCMFWEAPKESDDLQIGYCNKATQIWNATEWRDVNGETTLVEIDPTLLMYVQDGSDYYAGLRTKPDFFCAHYEEDKDD